MREREQQILELINSAKLDAAKYRKIIIILSVAIAVIFCILVLLIKQRVEQGIMLRKRSLMDPIPPIDRRQYPYWYDSSYAYAASQNNVDERQQNIHELLMTNR